MGKIPFRYDIVGSFLRPEILKEARESYGAKRITREDLTAIEDSQIRQLIEKEMKVGLKAVTDGEFRRRWWHLDFIAGLNGITVYDFVSKNGFKGIETKAQGTYVSGKLSFRKDHPFLSHFQFVKETVEELKGNKEVQAKQTIPGPGMIYLDSVVLSKQYSEHPIYNSIEDFCKDLVKTYQDAILAFYEAGCRYLQLDDTSWGALFSEKFRKIIKEKGYDPDELMVNFASVTKEILTVKPKDMSITLHMCKGNFQSSWLYEGTYEKIAKNLLGIEGIDGFFLEYDDQRSGDFDPLQYSKNQKIVLGLITTKQGKMEEKESIKNRIHEAGKVIPLERLCLSPQCGFASTEEGNHLSEQEQWEKVKLVIEIAKEVWKDEE